MAQVGKLNVYRNSEPEELAGLHSADRLMVKLIQIERLGPRIDGMLYRISFDEQWGLLDEVSHLQPTTWCITKPPVIECS
jgi:cytokinesis protein